MILIKKRWVFVFLVPTLSLLLLVYAVPFATVVISSFTNWKNYSNKLSFAGVDNYFQLFGKDAYFRRALWNTVIWVLLQSTVHVFLGTLVALILAKRPIGWRFVRTVYMVPNIVSLAALGVIYLNIFNPEHGAMNSFIRLFGASDFSQNWYFDAATAFWTTTATWLFFAGLITILVLAEIRTIPESQYESARMDGATPTQIDRLIILPQLRNILGTCVIIAATSMLKEFELIFMTTKGGPGTATLNLPLYLYKTALIENNYGYANTIGTFTIVLGIVLVVAFSRAFRLGKNDLEEL